MKGSFKIECIEQHNADIINIFRSHFSNLGYLEHQPASLISAVDHSVRFIGSTTNVFKSYIINQTVPSPGFFLIQKCLRTQNSKIFLNDDIIPDWSSYFTAMGVIAPAGRLSDLVQETFNYLLKLNIEKDRIRIAFCHEDQDLIASAQKVDSSQFNIYIDNNRLKPYRHEYGLTKIRGRNLNFAKQKPPHGEGAVFEL